MQEVQIHFRCVQRYGDLSIFETELALQRFLVDADDNHAYDDHDDDDDDDWDGDDDDDDDDDDARDDGDDDADEGCFAPSPLQGAEGPLGSINKGSKLDS